MSDTSQAQIEPNGFTAGATEKPCVDTAALIADLEGRGCTSLHERSVDEVREWFENVIPKLALDEQPQVASVRDLSIPVRDGNIDIRIYRPTLSKEPLPAIVCLHASGYVFGGLDTIDDFCRLMADGADCVMIAVDYRRAPEHKFPGPVNDCFDAFSWVADNAAELNIDPKRIAIGGDSSGGTMAAVVSVLARDEGGPEICHQLLWYPGTGSLGPTESSEAYSFGYFLENPLQFWSVKHYLNDKAELMDPRVQPLRFDDLSNLPPCYLMTAGFDPRRDDNAKYATRLKDSGVPVTFTCVESTIHGFLFMLGKLPVAQQAVEDSIAYTKKMFADLA